MFAPVRGKEVSCLFESRARRPIEGAHRPVRGEPLWLSAHRASNLARTSQCEGFTASSWRISPHHTGKTVTSYTQTMHLCVRTHAQGVF